MSEALPKAIEKKIERLVGLLQDAGSLLIAYSGGVDSTLLVSIAHEVLPDRLLAVTAFSPVHPRHEIDMAQRFAEKKQIKHLLIPSGEMDLPLFLENNPDRCYHCKKALFKQLRAVAEQYGMKRVAHGANVDDLGDYRPGFRAAREMDIWAPLVDAGLKKDEIRVVSKVKGLPTWSKPSGACLATRIPYGSRITKEKLEAISLAERYLMEQGVRQCRVRHHGDMARIELDSHGVKIVMEEGVKQAIIATFKDIGFMYVALDLEGYESGRMNRSLAPPKRPGRFQRRL